MAHRLDEALPEARQAWESGMLDWVRVNMIAERNTTLSAEQSRTSSGKSCSSCQ
jgi:hypothetical protein